ncbi:MAG: DNA internalization-related competence protein ComEC/Rec2 [Acidobacteriota bacterium]
MRKEEPFYRSIVQPVCYFCLAFIIGILLAHILYFPGLVLVISLGIVIVAASWGYYREWTWLSTIAIMAGFVIVGALLLKIELRERNSTKMVHDIERQALLTDSLPEVYGEICTATRIAPGRAYMDLCTDMISIQGRTIAVRSRLRLTIWFYNKTAKADYQQLQLVPGTVIRVKVRPYSLPRFKNPGMFDEREWLQRQGYDMAVSVSDPLLIEVLFRKEGSKIEKLINQVRQYLFTRIDMQLNSRAGGLVKAALLGNGYFLEKDISESFRAGGIFHVLVISGSHIALIVLIANTALSQIISSQRTRFLLIALTLWFYGMLVGADTPVMRAVVMATIGMMALLLERQIRPANTLGLAGLVLLANNPMALFEAGFQLSFLAVCLILLAALPLISKLSAIGSWRPTVATPYPPQCPLLVKIWSELLFWRSREFVREQAESPVKYSLEKTAWAQWLERYYLQLPLRMIMALLLISIIVHLGLLPLSTYYFNRITFIGVLLNIGAELLVSGLFVETLIFIAVDACSSTAGHYIGLLIEATCNLFVACAAPAQLFSAGSFRVAHYTGGLMLIYWFYYLPITVFIGWLNRWQPLGKPAATRPGWFCHLGWLALSLLYLVLLVAVIIPLPFKSLSKASNDRAPQLEIAFLDVGQGDAVFISFPHGTTMMVDAGGNLGWGLRAFESDKLRPGSQVSIGEQVVSRYLWWRGVERLDYLVATHTDLDHIEGLSELLKNFPVGCAVVSGVPQADAEYQRFAKQAEAAKVPLLVWSRGQHFNIDGVEVEVLWPVGAAMPRQLNNNYSLVLRLRYGQHSILLTGDIEQAAEKELIFLSSELRSDVLKAPHHGSKTSSSADFIAQVAPQYVIISAPLQSRFKHPHKEVLARYCQQGTEIYQTGFTGMITVSTNGQELKVSHFTGEAYHCPSK